MMLWTMAAVTGLAGWIGAPWWAAIAGSCLIALMLFQEDARVYPPAGQEASWELAETLTNILFGACGGLAAFAIGRLASLIV